MIILDIIMGLVLAINVILCIYQYRAYKKAKAELEQIKRESCSAMAKALREVEQ